MSQSTITLSAWHALRAVYLKPVIGSYAARRYAVKHGVLGLYRLAQQLQAVS